MQSYEQIFEEIANSEETEWVHVHKDEGNLKSNDWYSDFMANLGRQDSVSKAGEFIWIMVSEHIRRCLQKNLIQIFQEVHEELELWLHKGKSLTMVDVFNRYAKLMLGYVPPDWGRERVQGLSVVKAISSLSPTTRWRIALSFATW